MKRSELRKQVKILKEHLRYAYKEYKIWKKHDSNRPRTKEYLDSYTVSYTEIMKNYWREECLTLKKIIEGLEEFLER